MKYQYRFLLLLLFVFVLGLSCPANLFAAPSTLIQMEVAHTATPSVFLAIRIRQTIPSENLPSILQYDLQGNLVGVPNEVWQAVTGGWIITLDTTGIGKFNFGTNAPLDELAMDNSTTDWTVTDPSGEGDPIYLSRVVVSDLPNKTFLPLVLQ